jgi:hypothetical protein
MRVKGSWFSFPESVYRLGEEDELAPAETRSSLAWNKMYASHMESVQHRGREIEECLAEVEKERVRLELEKQGVIKGERVERTLVEIKRVGKAASIAGVVSAIDQFMEEFTEKIDREKEVWSEVKRVGKKEFVREREGRLEIHLSGKKYIPFEVGIRPPSSSAFIRAKIIYPVECEGYIEEKGSTEVELLKERVEHDKMLGNHTLGEVRVGIWRSTEKGEQALLPFYVLCAMKSGISRKRILEGINFLLDGHGDRRHRGQRRHG